MSYPVDRRPGPPRGVLTIALALGTLWAAPETSPAVKVAMGDNHGVWLKADGTVWVWGGNRCGQLGIAGDDAYEAVQVPELSGMRDVAAGDCFTAAVQNNGTLWIWGENGYGESGIGATQASSKPVRIDSLTGVISVSASGRNILARRSDGTVWEWGDRPEGRPSSTPKQVENFTGVVAIAASQRHSVALKSDGTVWVWGDHGASVLDNATNGLALIPKQVGGLSEVTAIAAGYKLTVALKKDGTVWTVGYGAAGGLGNGSTEDSTKPAMVSGLTGVKAVAAGYMHSVALKGDGTVWSWGYNHEHQLGNLHVTAEQSAKPVRSGTLSGVVAITAAASHSAAIDSEGIAWAWGQNDDGALGIDEETLKRSDVPMRVGQDVPGECIPLVCLRDREREGHPDLRRPGSVGCREVERDPVSLRSGKRSAGTGSPRRSFEGTASLVLFPRGEKWRLSRYGSFFERYIHISRVLRLRHENGSGRGSRRRQGETVRHCLRREAGNVYRVHADESSLRPQESAWRGGV